MKTSETRIPTPKKLRQLAELSDTALIGKVVRTYENDDAGNPKPCTVTLMGEHAIGAARSIRILAQIQLEALNGE